MEAKQNKITSTYLGQNDTKLEPNGKQSNCATAEQWLRNHGIFNRKELM